MAYSISWASDPSDTTLAKDIDDEIVKLKDALEERLEDVLIDDIDAEPWTLKNTVTGLVTGLKEYIPFTDFLYGSNPSGTMQGFTGILPILYMDNRSAYGFRVGVPRGATIKNISIAARIPSTTGIVCDLLSCTLGSTTATWNTVETVNMGANANGLFNIYSKDVSVLLGDGFYMCMIYATQNADRMLGACLTYDRPSHLVG